MFENYIDTVNTFVDCIPAAQNHLVSGLNCAVVELGVLTTADSGIRINQKPCLIVLEIAGAAAEEIALLQDSVSSVDRVLDIIYGSVVVFRSNSVRV